MGTNAIFVAGGIKVVLPLFANFEEMRSKKVFFFSHFNNIEKEGDSEKQNDLYTEVMLLFRGFMFGSGGLRLRKEIYETRAIANSLAIERYSKLPKELSNGLLGAIFLTTRTLIEIESALANDFIRYLLLDFDLWSKADWNVQLKLFSLIENIHRTPKFR